MSRHFDNIQQRKLSPVFSSYPRVGISLLYIQEREYKKMKSLSFNQIVLLSIQVCQWRREVPGNPDPAIDSDAKLVL